MMESIKNTAVNFNIVLLRRCTNHDKSIFPQVQLLERQKRGPPITGQRLAATRCAYLHEKNMHNA